MTILDDIVRLRLLTVVLARLLAVLFAVVGLSSYAFWLAEGLRDGDFFDITYYTEIILFGGVLIISGAALFIGARPFARVIVPMTIDPDCPVCGYAIADLAAERCPECGTPVPASLVAIGGSPVGRRVGLRTNLARRWRTRLLYAVSLFLLAMSFILGCVAVIAFLFADRYFAPVMLAAAIAAAGIVLYATNAPAALRSRPIHTDPVASASYTHQQREGPE